MEILDVLKLKADHWITGLIMTLATLAPGAVLLFLFKRDLFLTLELGKVILLSLGLTLPLVFINLIIAWPHALESCDELKFDSKEIVTTKQLVLSACLFSSISLYIGIAASYLLGFSFRYFCLTVAGTDILLGLLAWRKAFKHS